MNIQNLKKIFKEKRILFQNETEEENNYRENREKKDVKGKEIEL